MATAEELLAGGVAPNEVSDRPNLLVIDNDLRTISIQPESRVIGVESDEDVNRLYFSMPRMYNDTDLSLFNAYINYMNANADGDVYIVTDLQPTGDEITFSWLIGRHATEYKGEVKFVVCLKRNENGEIVQEFNTTVHKLTVLEGLEIELTEEEEGKVRDVLAQLLSLIETQKDEAIEAVKTEGAIQLAAISTSGAAQVQDINDTGKEQKDAVEAAGASRINAIEQKGAQTLATIPEDYTDLDATIKLLKDTKADAIMDTSERAASHSLHAQDGRMSVTLHGKTTETGTGDKSPDNPYTISGVDTAVVHVGSKNLFPGKINGTGNPTEVRLGAGVYTLSQETGTPNAWYTRLKKNGQIVTVNKNIGGANMYFSGSSYWYYSGSNYTALKITLDDTYDVQIAQLNADGTINGMLNAGDTALPYEPYNANNIAMPLLPDGAPLYGNGTVDDTVENDVLVGGERKCRVTRRWKTVTLDGTQTMRLGTVTGGTEYRLMVTLDGANGPTDNNNISQGGCNKLVTKSTNNNYNKIESIAFSSVYAYVYIEAMKDATLDDWKAYLAANPIEVYYPLATEQIYMSDPLTLRKPDTLTTGTVTVNGSAETEVTYAHDTKHYTDSQHDSLARAVEQNAEAVNSLNEDIADLTAGYELINRFTVSEDVASLVVDMDSAGKPFELVSAIFRISCGGNVTPGTVTGQMVFSTASYDYFCRVHLAGWKYPGYKVSDTAYRSSDAVTECDVRDGAAHPLGYFGDVGAVTSNAQYFPGDVLIEARNTAIVKAFTTFAVPKNAIVSLYGIRKEKADG